MTDVSSATYVAMVFDRVDRFNARVRELMNQPAVEVCMDYERSEKDCMWEVA